MALSRLIGCNVYISEGRNVQLIRRLEELCQKPSRVALATTFIDEPYNRTGLTLVSANVAELSAAVLSVAAAALSAIDLRSHAADHPRLGVLDHVSLHPLGAEATLQHAAQAAASLGQQLAAPPFGLPVYFYGAAHPAGRKLAEIRRRLGYFKPASNPNTSSSSSSSSPGDWIGNLPAQALASYPPDAGPSTAPPAAGVVTIGAVPWVVNYNVPLYTADRAAAAAVARAVSTRGGGLPGVEAMALQHGPCVIEVATNLVDLDWTTYSSSSRAQTSGTAHSLAAAAAESSSTACHAPAADAEATDNRSAAAAAAASGGPNSRQCKGAGPEQVLAAIAVAAELHGLPPPGAGYVTNKLPRELLESARQQLLVA